MQFIILFGPPAVGKMTVGLEIEKASGIKLFHNHSTIEVVLSFFDFGTSSFNRLVNSFRRQIFEEVSNSDLPGLTFTYVWDLDSDSDTKFVTDACATFESVNSNIALVELKANLEQRLVRNRAPDRLAIKLSKRDIEKSESNIMDLENNYRVNTNGEALELPYKHFVIDNSEMSAKETARLILKRLGVTRNDA